MTVYKTIEDLQDLLSDMANDPAKIRSFDLSEHRFRPDPIVIKIDGDGYDSCIDTEIMKHFIDLQDILYDFVKLAKYGDLGKRLKDEDKAGFKLMVQVKPGCTELIANFSEQMENLFVNMNGWQSMTTAIVIVGCITLYGIFKVKSDNKTKVELKKIELEQKKEDNKHEVEVIQAVASVVDNTLKKSHDIFETFAEMNAKISIDKEELSKRVLREISTERLKIAKEKSKVEESVVTKYVSGNFVVESLNFKDECTTVNLRNTKTNEVLKNVNLGTNSLNEKQSKLVEEAAHRKSFDFEIAINETSENGKILGKGIKGVSDDLLPGLIPDEE